MERRTLYEKFKALSWQQQLGNIASTLAKISTQVTISQQDQLTSHLLREAALMIEWSANNVPRKYHWELATLQKELLAWLQVMPINKTRTILALHTRSQSDRLMHMAGFWQDEEILSGSVT